MNKVLKIGFTVLLVAMIILLSVVPIFAADDAGPIDPGGITGTAVSTSSMQKIGGQIVTIVSVAGSIIAVVILVVLGIKYMMGSAEEKADYKKSLLPYIIGAAFVFAASALAGIIYNFASNISA